MLWLLQERLVVLELRRLSIFAARVLLASLVMGLGLLLVRVLLDHILVTTNPTIQHLGFGGTIVAIIKLLIELAVGLFIYIRATRLLGLAEFWKQGPIKSLLDRFRLSWL